MTTHLQLLWVYRSTMAGAVFGFLLNAAGAVLDTWLGLTAEVWWAMLLCFAATMANVAFALWALRIGRDMRRRWKAYLIAVGMQ